MELLIIYYVAVHGGLRGDGPHAIEAAPALLDSALNQRTLHTANATLAELLSPGELRAALRRGFGGSGGGTLPGRREPGWSITWRTAATGAAACDLLGALAAPFRDPKMSAAGRRGGARVRVLLNAYPTVFAPGPQNFVSYRG